VNIRLKRSLTALLTALLFSLVLCASAGHIASDAAGHQPQHATQTMDCCATVVSGITLAPPFSVPVFFNIILVAVASALLAPEARKVLIFHPPKH
jgi:uncharacterized membrane protein YoaK (UPF0700 family)